MNLLFVLSIFIFVTHIDGNLPGHEAKYMNNWMPKPILDAHIFSNTEPFYTVLAHPSKQINDLILDMRNHGVSYVLVDKENFAREDLDSISRKYICNRNFGGVGGQHLSNEVYRKPMIFFKTEFYVGGIFEMYEIIASFSADSVAIENAVESTVKKWTTFEDLQCLALYEDEEESLKFRLPRK